MNFKPQAAHERLIVALDTPDVAKARTLVDSLSGTVSFFKIGMRLQFAGGLDLARALADEGKRVFLDVKLLDIDSIVAAGVADIARMGVSLMTVHAYPGAMRAAVSAGAGTGLGLLGVTVLTSMDDEALEHAGYACSVNDLVKKRALAAQAAGMTGVVCSAREARVIRTLLGPDMLIVTPGIRPANGNAADTLSDDQVRVVSAAEAVRNGADYLVVGRPIVEAASPLAAAQRLIEDIAAV